VEAKTPSFAFKNAHSLKFVGRGLRLGHLKPPREIFGMRGGEGQKFGNMKVLPPPMFSSLLSV